jgi:hypothetical protein
VIDRVFNHTLAQTAAIPEHQKLDFATGPILIEPAAECNFFTNKILQFTNHVLGRPVNSLTLLNLSETGTISDKNPLINQIFLDIQPLFCTMSVLFKGVCCGRN